VTALWRIYHPQVLRLLIAKRSASPEDVASQVWMDVSRSLNRFDGDGTDFRRWVFTIASRRSIDGHRRRKRHRADSIDARHAEIAALGTERAFEANDSLNRALAIVGQLSPSTAEAVMLRVVYDLSVAQVAEVMGRSEGAVRVLVHRGLSRLRDLVVNGSTEPDQEILAEDVTRGATPALT
jgi:RNA polymerase sigma-70 factor (ECF subfamily)